MLVLLASLVAGMFTALAPCTLPFLPIIIGGSISSNSSKIDYKRIGLVIGGLVTSIFVFSLLLKATTVLLDVPQAVWQIMSGLIIIILGITFVAPHLWQKLLIRLGLSASSSALLQSATQSKSPVLVGAALGPVFNSCSPTYALIIAILLPSGFAFGLLNLIAYCLGLALMLFLVALMGQAIITKIRWLGTDNRVMILAGTMLIIVGIAVVTGLDKALQTSLLNIGLYDPFKNIEKTFSVGR